MDLQKLFSAFGDFGSWLTKNLDTDQADEVTTEQLLKMQKSQQQTLLIVMGLSIAAMTFTVYWSGDSPM